MLHKRTLTHLIFKMWPGFFFIYLNRAGQETVQSFICEDRFFAAEVPSEHLRKSPTNPWKHLWFNIDVLLSRNEMIKSNAIEDNDNDIFGPLTMPIQKQEICQWMRIGWKYQHLLCGWKYQYLLCSILPGCCLWIWEISSFSCQHWLVPHTENGMSSKI